MSNRAARPLLGLLLALLPLPALAQDEPYKPLPSRLTSPVLEKFANETEFRAYLRAVAAERRARKIPRWAMRHDLANQYASLQDQDVPPCATPEECPDMEGEAGNIIVTGAKVSSPVSITNTQEAGVDEGDIVKQFGQYLLVLQDGRIFVIDTRARDGKLALVERTNVYRSDDQDTWYDEMLVQDDHVVVTGYSYDDEATEVAIFRINAQGKLTSEGVFLISSGDYYDPENYSSRLVGDQFIVYTPLDLHGADPDDPLRWPMVRRWAPEEKRDEAIARGRRLFDARNIYKPVQPTLVPVVHTVSVCPLGAVRKDRDMQCRSTALVGPENHEFYVSPKEAWLWVTPGWSEYDNYDRRGTCGTRERPGPADAHPAMLYRLPLSGRAVTARGTLGVPIDQFSLDSDEREFRALLRWMPIRCGVRQDEPETQLQYFHMPLSGLSARPSGPSRGAYTALPDPGGRKIENRFTGTHLVYGGRESWGSYPPDEDDEDLPLTATAVVVPIDAPTRATTFSVPHNIIRVEQAGGDAVLTGYRDPLGLQVSVIDLSATAPRLASTIRLDGRYESEGRSHAFNSRIEPDGHGLLGLPTVQREHEGGRWWWRSDASDISFLSVDTLRRLGDLGALEGREDAVDKSYECEVSCIDWYGNSRPVFVDGRIFALSGTELIEGRVVSGKIAEVQRLNLSLPVPR